jgi:hypothetical protein
MRNTNRTKIQAGFPQTDARDENGKRGYYFHADEDFREDPNWKPGSTPSSKRNSATIKRLPNRP